MATGDPPVFIPSVWYPNTPYTYTTTNSTTSNYYYCYSCGNWLLGNQPHYCGRSITDYQVMPSAGWACPRCHKIHAYWVSSCDCKKREFCIICQQESPMMEHAPYPSAHDSEPVCQECMARLIDETVKENKFRKGA